MPSKKTKASTHRSPVGIEPARASARKPHREVIYTQKEENTFNPTDGIVAEGPEVLQPSKLAYRDDARGLWLYHGDCLEVMDTLLAKYPQGVFDLIFADPPYFLSNGGITCHAGKMVKVDKGDWDKSRGPELRLAQLRVLRALQHGFGKPLLPTRTSVPSTSHSHPPNETRRRQD